MRVEVVRQWGSGKCHVAHLPDDAVVEFTAWGATGEAADAPVVAVCGTMLMRSPVVMMTKAKVDCRPCSRLSGVSEASGKVSS